MDQRRPEGPKAENGPAEAEEGYIPKPPSPAAVKSVSEAQGMITDEWSGEPAEGGQGGQGGQGGPFAENRQTPNPKP